MFDYSVYDLTFFCAIGFIIILLQSDYFLTLQGYSLYRKYYAEYYTYEAYELNPIWRKSVETAKIFNIKHILLTILLVLLTALLLQLNKDAYLFVVGMAIFAYSIIDLRHIQNIRLFLHFKKRKTDIQGNMKVSLTMGLKQSYIAFTNYALLLVLTFVLVPSLLVLGGVVGVSLIAFRLYMGYRRRIGKEKAINKDLTVVA